MVWWVPLAMAGAQLVGSMAQGKRSADREVPGLAQYMAQSLASRRDAQLFSRSAADPSSEWFRGVSGVLEEDFINQAFRALREKDIMDMRKLGVGVPASYVHNPERRDEAKAAAWIDALQRATLKSRAMTPEMLLTAARASAGSAGDLRDVFRVYSAYGDTEATRQKDMMESGGKILGGLLQHFAGS